MSGWASHHIEQLQGGETVSFRPRGNSMNPKIRSGQLVTVEPVGDRVLSKGMVVLVAMNARTHYLHYISATAKGRVQISNAAGRVNGWVGVDRVHGVLTAVDD